MTDPRVRPDAPAAEDLAITLNEVLASLLERTRRLLRGDLTPGLAEEIRRIEGEGLKARAAIRDAWSRERRVAPKSCVVDPAPLLLRTLEWVEPRARSAGVRVSVGLSPDLPQVVGDPVTLEHGWLLVMFCALKAVHAPGEDLVVLADTVWEADLPLLRVSIADERASPPLGPRPDLVLPGEGLGLGVARDVFLDHGGRLEIRGRAASGLVVTTWLPGVARV